MHEMIKKGLRNAQYFGEKSGQVEPSSLTAFGISLESRYGQAHELIDMLQFAAEAAGRSVAPYVESIFFDSKACIPCFKFVPSLTLRSDIEQELLQIAYKHFHQFMWLDDLHVADEP